MATGSHIKAVSLLHLASLCTSPVKPPTCMQSCRGYYVAERPCRSAALRVHVQVSHAVTLAADFAQSMRFAAKEKMQLALVNLGPSILGGALTTAAGTAFLLPCRIVLFVKLGTMLVPRLGN